MALKPGPELRSAIQLYHERSGNRNLSESLRELLIRGLYIGEKPGGHFSEAAYRSATQTVKGTLMQVLHQHLKGSPFQEFLRRIEEDTRTALGDHFI